jgi:hypothetical protein
MKGTGGKQVERSPFEVENCRNKKLATQDVSRSFQHELTRLFERFKLDLEELLGIRPAIEPRDASSRRRSAFDARRRNLT